MNKVGWMNDLYQTYEENISEVGKTHKSQSGKEYMLLPVAHTTQEAQIEITVDEFGNFYQAKIVDKDDATTTIPCTEASSSRTANVVPHPLHDKLMYVAGDFQDFGGVVKAKNTPFQDYLSQLSKWVNSPYSSARIRAIYEYVKKGTLVKDLVKASIIELNDDGKMLKPEVFVRFNTYKPGTVNTKVWHDYEVFDSFIKFNNQILNEYGLCYITGEDQKLASFHAKGLRRKGDNAKLISSKKDSYLTFKGRFIDASEVVTISYEVSQKAHNALKWLISKQGKNINDRVFLVWGNKQTDIISPQEDAITFFQSIGLSTGDDEEGSNTHDVFARKFNQAIDGYKSDLSYNPRVILMVFDAATTGRLAILYYQQLETRDYIDRIQNWHQTCTWRHSYKTNKDGKRVVFYGAPATRDIVFAAYGPNANDKLVKDTMLRLLPCIVAGQRLPLDIIKSAFNRAINPEASSIKDGDWEKTLSISCALINKHYQKEGYSVALDVTNRQRDYLFGRLLAVADVLENSGLDPGEKRATNAIRYMNAFATHPARTWKVIQANIQPYQVKLGRSANYYNRIIDEIASEIKIEDFNNKPLSGVFLLGFYSQRQELYTPKKG